MRKRTKIQKIKRLLKIGIATGILVLLFVLGLFVKINYTFENSNMKKWLGLSDTQRINTVRRVVANADDMDLLLNCVTKIANLPDSENMNIRDAVSLCYNGMKINAEKSSENSESNDK